MSTLSGVCAVKPTVIYLSTLLSSYLKVGWLDGIYQSA